MEYKQCVICGAPFVPKHDDQQCCGAECSRKKAGMTTRRYNTCQYCGKPFWRRNAYRMKYCSHECVAAAAHARAVPKPPVQPTVYEKHCLWCGKAFTTTMSHKKYCCRECGYDGLKRDKRKQWADEFQPKQFTCKECGTVFTTECGHPRSSFCSHQCAETHDRRKEHQTARHKSYMRQMNIEREKQIASAFVEDVDYERLYKRDRGVCQICGLPVHPTKGIDNNWDGTIDHVVPLSDGGEHSMRNCQLAHRICNSLKCRSHEEYALNWEEKAKENNYWRVKYERYRTLMEQDALPPSESLKV